MNFSPPVWYRPSRCGSASPRSGLPSIAPPFSPPAPSASAACWGRITNASSRGNASPVRASTCVWGYTAPAGRRWSCRQSAACWGPYAPAPSRRKIPPLKPPPPSSKACLPRRKPPFRWQMPSGPMPMPGCLTAGMAKTAPTVRTEKTAKTALPAKPVLKDQRAIPAKPAPKGRKGKPGKPAPKGRKAIPAKLPLLWAV